MMEVVVLQEQPYIREGYFGIDRNGIPKSYLRKEDPIADHIKVDLRSLFVKLKGTEVIFGNIPKCTKITYDDSRSEYYAKVFLSNVHVTNTNLEGVDRLTILLDESEDTLVCTIYEIDNALKVILTKE